MVNSHKYSAFDSVNDDVCRKIDDFKAFVGMIGIPKGTTLVLEGDAVVGKAVSGSLLTFGISSEKVNVNFLKAVKSFIADTENVMVKVYEGDSISYAIESGIAMDASVLMGD